MEGFIMAKYLLIETNEFGYVTKHKNVDVLDVLKMIREVNLVQLKRATFEIFEAKEISVDDFLMISKQAYSGSD